MAKSFYSHFKMYHKFTFIFWQKTTSKACVSCVDANVSWSNIPYFTIYRILCCLGFVLLLFAFQKCDLY